MRHLVIGAELVLSKNLHLRGGYNFLKRRELLLEGYKGMAGLSFGVMLRVKRIEFSYANAAYHVAANVHNFTVILNTKEVVRKKKVVK
jgi:hypothetical protein